MDLRYVEVFIEHRLVVGRWVCSAWNQVLLDCPKALVVLEAVVVLAQGGFVLELALPTALDTFLLIADQRGTHVRLVGYEGGLATAEVAGLHRTEEIPVSG